jgi:1-acyl-sn-glycerol-3-phosphate acyltransferase
MATSSRSGRLAVFSEPLRDMARSGRAVGTKGRSWIRRMKRMFGGLGFPYKAPTVPRGVVVPAKPSKLEANYDTTWAREAPARAVRKMLMAGPLRLLVEVLADPEINGIDRLADYRPTDGADPTPLIFTPNHHSHLDTGLCLMAIPEPWRSKVVVGAAADYFFTTHLTAAASALALNAIPIDRETVSRKSSDLAKDLVDQGWSLLLFPEGGRSPDGWGQPFKGGAAYLSAKTGAPVVPVFIDGAGAIFGKGMKRPKPGRTTVVFGAPIHPVEGENTRRFNERIEQAVTELGDETLTDWWGARQRAAQRTNPSLSGPEYTGWRRQWALSEYRKLGKSGQRRRQKYTWPKFD